MGLRGPVPKSAEERLYEGNPAHRPLPLARAPLSPLAIDRPKGMSAAARRVWDEMVAPLGPMAYQQYFVLRDLCLDVAKAQELQRGQRQLIAEWKREAKAAGKKLVAPLAQHIATEEGGKLERAINALKRHVAKMQMQYGLTLLSSQRLEGVGGGFMPTVAGEPLDPIEEQIQ